MFLRSCVSVLRQCAKTSPRPLLSRAIHTSRLYCSSNEENTEEHKVDDAKSVTLVFKRPDGSITKEIAKVNETIYHVVKRMKDIEVISPGYGECLACNSCATCHVIMEEKFYNLQTIHEYELDNVLTLPECTELSRLGCQVVITEEMDGMVVELPPTVARLEAEEESNAS